MVQSETIIQKEKNGISYLQFKKLLDYPELSHMYVLKNGDMNFKRADKSMEKLEQDYQRVCKLEQMNGKNVVRPTQTHTDVVKCVYQKYNDDRADLYLPEYENVDGLLTNKSGLVLSTTNADCNLILLYDTKNKVIGNIHSGWKGTFQKIALKAVEKMKQEYGSNPEDIVACFAPHIHKCCFEVHEDVEKPCKEIFSYTGKIEDIIAKGKEDTYSIVQEKSIDFPETTRLSYLIPPKCEALVASGEATFLIDTTLINKILLEEAGLKPENIIDSEICSKCHADEVHSRRAEGVDYKVGTLLVSLK